MNCTTRTTCGLCAALLVIALAATPCGASEPPSEQDANDRRAAITTLEEQLWQNILALEQPTPTTRPHEAWFADAQRRLEAQLGALQTYVTLYPGGAHRDQAIRRELSALFELAVLRGEEPVALRERVADLLREPPSQAAQHEAAYWQIICEQFDPPGTTGRATGRPASAAPPRPHDRLLPAYREYLDRYPRSRYVPRLASLLFEDALRRGDREQMRSLVAHLARHFPDHALTAALRARWWREKAVGRRFWPSFGHPLLIVVWGGFDPSSRRCAQQVERFRHSHPDLRVVGVSLDASAEQTAAACQELGIDWPRINDGRGWGGAFVRAWGIRRIPQVFVIDRTGRLLGVAGDQRWEDWARQATQSPSSASNAADPAVD